MIEVVETNQEYKALFMILSCFITYLVINTGFRICDAANFIIHESVPKADIDFAGLILICRADTDLYMYRTPLGAPLILSI